MFGIPGSLLEYSSRGSSLTYQNLESEYTKFVRTCLAPNYLEPIEQALTDLLSRSIVIRFYVDGLLRADIKTRFEVYKTGIESGVLTPEMAQVREGILPGDIENAPVPAAPPTAIPAPLQNRSQEAVRCEGMRLLRGRLTSCGKLLAEASPFVGTCPRCGRVYAAAGAPALRTSIVPVAIRARVQDIIIPEPPEEDRIDRLAVAMAGMAEAMTTMATREAPPQVTIAEGAIQMHNAPPVVNVSTPDVNVTTPQVTIAEGAIQVHNAPPVINVSSPIEPGAIQVNLPTQPVTVERPVVNVPPSVVDVTVDSSEFAAAIREMQGALTPRPMDRTVERDSRGLIVRVRETPKEEIA
jgi:hypothetical protein